MSVRVLPRLNSVLPRVGLYVLASLLLHALILGLVDRGLEFAGPRADTDEHTIDAALIAPPAAPVPATPKPVRTAPKPPPRPAPAPAEPPAPAAQDVIAAAVMPTEVPPPEPAPPADAPPVPDISAVATPEAAAPTQNPPAADQSSAAPPPTVTQWPPNGRAHYRVEALQGSLQYHGTSDLDWTASQSHYRIEQTTGINLLVTTLVLQSSTSEGAIDAHGLAPERYTEKRRNRATVATNFNRDTGSPNISFSASSNAVPLTDGVQDRASVVFQLAGMLASQTDASALQQYEVQLAGTRDAQTWRFEAAGSETVTTGMGSMRAQRYVREPRADSYESRIEIWYAPQTYWYPVRIRYTERKGDVIDLTLENFEIETPR